MSIAIEVINTVAANYAVVATIIGMFTLPKLI